VSDVKIGSIRLDFAWAPCRWPRWLALLGCLVAVGVPNAATAAADPRTDATNKGVVELETAGASGNSLRIAEDLAALIDDGATRRVLPVVGRTALQNLWDLVLLRGIDMAVLQTDVVDSVRQNRSLPAIDTAFTYITKLYNEEFHLLAGPDVKTVADLANKRVGIGVRGSGSGVTAERLFGLLKIPVEPVEDRPQVAIDKLRHGQLAAVAVVAGKPSSLLQELPPGEGWHFIPIPLEANVVNAYVPATLNATDYPALIAAGRSVDTVAVGSLLAVARLQPGSERYRNVANFVDVFFTQFRSLLEPGHDPKWAEMNLATDLPGLVRFAPAQLWLDRNAAVAKQNPQDVKALFSRFLDSRQQVLEGPSVSDQQKQELFNEFQRWQAGQSR
jgi:TRAP-type uncharacterized transport system substrate-binding protein